MVTERLRFGDVRSGKEIKSLAAQSFVYTIATSPDGQKVLSGGSVKTQSGGWENTLKIWDLNTGNEIRTISRGLWTDIRSVAFSYDGHRILCPQYRTVVLLDADEGRVLLTFDGNEGGVNAVAFSPDDHAALTGGGDTAVKLWDLATGKELSMFTGHAGSVTSSILARWACGAIERGVQVRRHEKRNKILGYLDGRGNKGL